LGFGTKFKVVPAHLLSAATAFRNTVVMDVSVVRWKEAPVFKRSELSALSESDRVERIARFLDQTPRIIRSVRVPLPAAASGCCRRPGGISGTFVERRPIPKRWFWPAPSLERALWTGGRRSSEKSWSY